MTDCKKSFALILDCDMTITQDDTTSQLIRSMGENPENFWQRINGRISEGWDHPLLWMPELVKLSKERKKPLTRQSLEEAGKSLEFSPNIPKVFDELKGWFKERTQAKRNNIDLKIFIISSGLEDMLVHSKLLGHVDEIYGCTYDFDGNGYATAPKSAVTFTEKTRYLYSINKGIQKREERKDPQLVNKYMPYDERPIQLSNMIYIGDGPSDIPCFSIINRAGGSTVGIRGKKIVPYMDGVARKLSREFRPRWGPFTADYTCDSDLVQTIRDILSDMLKSIRLR